jgi:UDP-GlcNAc:undecaprenyl-phosphate GlcNAc-1-phosphate transferase
MRVLATVIVTSFGLGWILNRLLLSIALKYRALNKFDRLKEKKVTKLGGTAIFISFLIPIVYFGFQYITLDLTCSIIVSIVLIFLLGLRDDIRALSPWAKLIGQIIIISFLFFSGFQTEIIFFSPFVNGIITFLWIIGITNAINLLDILDGLAAGLVAISSLAFLLIAQLTGNILTSIIAASLLGSTLAFVKFNFPPAKIYMGDSGSLLLGFILSLIAIMLSYASLEHRVALVVPLAVLGLPIFDLTFLVFMRLVKRKSIIRKSKDHFALYLIHSGFSLKKAVVIMYILGILFSILAILILKTSEAWGMVILGLILFICLTIAYKINKAQVR